MHVHCPGRADPYTGKISAGSTVYKFIETFMKCTHGHTAMLFSAGCDTYRTSSASFSILFNMHCHGVTPLLIIDSYSKYHEGLCIILSGLQVVF